MEFDLKTEEGMRKYVNRICEIKGWILQRDEQTLSDLIDGLVSNKNRYGYQSCPCRFASGKRDLDRDLICPCDYSGPDVEEYGTCFCNLFLSPGFYDSHEEEFIQIPERRPLEKDNAAVEHLAEKE